MVTGVLARAHLEPLEGRRKRKATDDIDAAEQNPVQPSAAPGKDFFSVRFVCNERILGVLMC